MRFDYQDGRKQLAYHANRQSSIDISTLGLNIHCDRSDQFSSGRNLVLEHTGWRLLAILRRREPEEWPANDAEEDVDFHLL
jgi:hypothetical protein